MVETISYLTEARALFNAKLLSEFGQPAGATESDIRNLELAIDAPLPLAYREFLRWMGRDYQGIFRGSDVFVNNVLDNSETMQALFLDNKLKFPEGQIVVFFTHQGYAAAWFDKETKDPDPNCFFFSESSIDPKICSKEKFSTFILVEVQNAVLRRSHR